MLDWAAGYVADIDYTFGHYFELNPLHARLALLNAGYACPNFATGCELGFGQGLSINLHAAASTVRWYGTDFSPSQTAFARELASASGAEPMLVDEAFTDFTKRKDLPDFDFICLHGIWSWVNDENQAAIVDFLRRKLKIGGVLYISYNTQPGWADMAPIRDLMEEYAAVMGAEGVGTLGILDGTLRFVDKLIASKAGYIVANPLVSERFQKLKEHDRHYLAHEYFNRHWRPMAIAEVASRLATAKMEWACSANTLESLDEINLTPEQRGLLQEIPDPLFRQTVRDFCINQRFRKDFWIKGATKLTALERVEQIRQQRVVLTTHPANVPRTVSTGPCEIMLQDEIYEPILQALADHMPLTVGQLEKGLANRNINFAQLWQGLIVLSSVGAVQAAQTSSDIAKTEKQARRLNVFLLDQARHSSKTLYLASPVTGGGIPVSRVAQLFLLADRLGHKDSQTRAQFAWQVLASQGEGILRNGVRVSDDENLSILTTQAQHFDEHQLGTLKALGVA